MQTTDKNNKQSELLAPAGNLDKIKYAMEFGADAVYAGVPDFSLRSRIRGFDDENILEAIDFVHKKKKKIYLTANIFAHNRHISGLKEHLKIYKNHLPDAFIVSDIGVMETIRKIYPKVQIHVSTQANTTNVEAVRFWKKYGVSRVILARELSLEEIREIHEAVPTMELEYFVHGAMCMAYSGRCFLSAWQTGRSSNLGDCAQNCRWGYALVEEKRPGEYIPVEQDNFGTYLLNSKDLCLVEYLDKLKAAGVISFKIEGRAKSVSYLAQAVKSYRTALDIKPNDKTKKQKIHKIKKDLTEIVNRGYTTGFLFGECKENGQESRFSHIEEKYEFVGEVVSVKGRAKGRGIKGRSFPHQKDCPSRFANLVKIRVHNALRLKDKIQILQPKGENYFCKILGIHDDKTLEKLESAHGGQGRMVYIKINKKPQVMSVLRREK